MLKMIKIKNVPDTLYRKLRARAAIEGMTLSDYLMVEIRRCAERPSLKELRERLNTRKPISPKIPPAKAVRIERDLH
jgi:plasmid stability protein